MSHNHHEPKFGAGHASAMWRQGLAELRQALYTDSNIAQPPQYGIYGTKTPGEVMRERSGSDAPPEFSEPGEAPRSIFDGRLEEQGPSGEDRDHEPPAPERE